MSEASEIKIIPVYYDYLLKKKYPVVILVGGRNSGKSFFLEQLAVTNTHNSPGYKLLVIEDVETNIGAGVKDGIEKRIEEFGFSKIYSSTKQPPEIKHKLNGSSVIFKGYHSDEQQKQVKSLNEVTAAWYEEAENITYDQFKALRMQLRGGKPEDRQLFLSLNPVVSDSFINHYFFEQSPDKVYERFKDGRPKVFEKNINVELDDGETVEINSIPCIVIVSVHWDNSFLTKEQRADIEEFKTTDPEKYAMLAEGKFCKPSGTYFREFTPGIHTCDPSVLPVIPSHWKTYVTMDYGLDKLAAYKITVDERGRATVVNGIYESDLIISDAAKKLKETFGTNIYMWLAPPDLWNRRQETGKSVADIFYENGIRLVKTNNSRVAGWMAVKEWLKVYKDIDGELSADLRIFDTCTNLIRTIQAVQRDEKDPNDVATEPHELTHAPDALRGFCVFKVSPSASLKRTEPNPFAQFGVTEPKPYSERGESINVI